MGDWKAVTAATAMLVAWSIVCFTTPASSQQPDTTTQAESLKTLSIEQLLNVEVTSVSRRPEPLARAPSAIQVITQQDIRRSGASSLPEALRLATNLEVAQYGGTLGSAVHYRVYGSGLTRQPTVLPTGLDAADDWHFGQGGFRLDWDPSQVSHVSFQGDLYDGRISQPSAPEIAVSGENLVGRWSRTLSANADLRAQLYYDRTHRDIPGTF